LSMADSLLDYKATTKKKQSLSSRGRDGTGSVPGVWG
jgi:hypothetical protein